MSWSEAPLTLRRAMSLASRRAHLKALAATVGALGLTACGFRWRGAVDLNFQRVAFEGFTPRSPLARALREALEQGANAQVSGRSQAQVVLRALTDNREKVVVASTSAGQVRELELRVRFRFSLSSAQDRELIAPTELLQIRTLSYIERDALAKEQEEEQLYRAMQDDIVAQVMRRLAAVRDIR